MTNEKGNNQDGKYERREVTSGEVGIFIDTQKKDEKPKIERQKKGRSKKKKKKAGIKVLNGRGQAHIKSTYNNTIVTITDQLGNTIAWGSSGKCGFKGPKKSTPYAAGIVVKSIADAVKEIGVKEVDCFVKGVGSGREAAVRALNANGINIASIKDITSVPHNGCRPRNPRRI